MAAQKLVCTPVPPQTSASFRGLSVVDDSVAWVSGSKGTVGHSTDGGHTWVYRQVNGYETCDFRSVYAFGADTAIIANAGSPAYILLTQDGGASWQQVYQNKDTAAFIDGIDFWDNKTGLVFGDPINGRLLLLRTQDGGRSWQSAPEKERPTLAAGEAAFAASGTTLRCLPGGKALIATGGTNARLLTSADTGQIWQPQPTPMLHGRASRGIFTVAYLDEARGLIAGGDYLQDSLSTAHVFYTKDGGNHWQQPAVPTRGYRECVAYLCKKIVIATGPSGSDVSYDGGLNWQPLNDEKQYHVVRKSRTGNTTIMAGGSGKISLVDVKQ